MTLLILGEDIKRMIDFFILNKSTTPKANEPLLTQGITKKIGYFLKGSILTYFIISCFSNYSDRISRQNDNRFEYMTQFHTVDLFIKNGDTLNTEDGTMWKHISINGMSYWPETLNLITMDDAQQRFTFEVDTIAKQLSFKPTRGEDIKQWMITR